MFCLVAVIEPYLQSDSLGLSLLNLSLRSEILQNDNLGSSSGFQRQTQFAAYSSCFWITFTFLVHTATTLRKISHCMAPTYFFQSSFEDATALQRVQDWGW